MEPTVTERRRPDMASKLGADQASLPRAILTELKRLPSARNFPALLGLGLKRGRSNPKLAPQGDAPAACSTAPPPPAPQPPAPQPPAPQPARATLVSLDPTGLLLMEAANQLRDLAEAEAARRKLGYSPARQRSRWGAACSASDSEEEEEEEDAGACYGADGLLTASASCTTGSASLASQSVSLGRSAESVSMPASWRARALPKRARLERQYAIDLDQYCLRLGMHLPAPEDLDC